MPFIKCPECGKLNSVKLKNCPKCEAPMDMARASYSNTQPAAPDITSATAQPQNNPWGQPTQQHAAQPQNNPWGQPAQQHTPQPQNNPWGQPAQQHNPQPQNNPWGQPAQQHNPQPQNNPWGQPTQQNTPQLQNNPWGGQQVTQNMPPAIHCHSCGAPVMNGARFCVKCGTPVATSQPQHPSGIPTKKNPYCL